MEPTVILSLDLELCWGSFDHAYDDALIKMARWTHGVGVPNLLGHLTRNEISASWAIVGVMMRSSLPDVSAMPEVRYGHFPKPWFVYVPKAGDETAHPEWFGASLVQLIKRAEPRQEIGFHSFSHVLFGWPGMTRDRAVSEFAACAQMAQEHGFPTTCFVFPRNSVAYLPELAQAGFTCFRDVDAMLLSFSNRRLRSAVAVLADIAAVPPPIVLPSIKDGLVAIPGSLMIRYAAGWRKYIPDAARAKRLRKGLAEVQRRGGIFHVWFHPENLYAEWPRLENVVARFLEELGVLVRNHDVRCLTMGQLASEFLTNAGNVHREPELVATLNA